MILGFVRGGFTVTFKGTFDFSNITALEIETEVEGFQPRFDNFFALTTYDAQRTLILTTRGRLLILRCSLAACLRQFCERNRIRDYEMNAYYQLVPCRTQGLVAGHYRLVPSRGASNPHVVYYNAHFLDSKRYSKERQLVLLTFENKQGELFQLYIDACYSSFVRILAAAEKVSEYQVKNVEEEMWRLGMVRQVPAVQGSQEIFQQHQDAGRFNNQIQCKMFYEMLTTVFENSYGQKPDQVVYESVSNIFNAPLADLKRIKKE